MKAKKGKRKIIASTKPVKLPKSFEQKLKDGDVYDINTAASVSGFSVAHLRRLCNGKKIPHYQRGQHRFFEPGDIAALFQYIQAVKKA